MSINIRFPNITGHSEAEQLVQIKSYLHQLAEQLNWALTAIESGGSGGTSGVATSQVEISAETFYELKAMIIKSTDTVNAYYEKINKKLEGQYVEQEEFDQVVAEVRKSIPSDEYINGLIDTALGVIKNGIY